MAQDPVHHPWRVRSTVGLLMLILAFVGLIITDVVKDDAWNYWRAMVPVYAILSITLSMYLRSKTAVKPITKVWQEIVHWLGLVFSIYLVSVFVSLKLIGQMEAGLIVLILLSLATFLAGIYHDVIFLIVGSILGFFALSTALLHQYLYTLMLPVTCVAAMIMILIIYKNVHHNKLD